MQQRPSPNRDSQLARIAVLRTEYILLEEESRKLELLRQANAVAGMKQLDTCANYYESKRGFVESETTVCRHEPKSIRLNFALEEVISDPVVESCLEFCAPISETLEAVQPLTLLEDSLQSLVVSVEQREFFEPVGHSIAYEASLQRPAKQDFMSYDTVVPVEIVPEDHTRRLHGSDVFRTKQTSFRRLSNRLHLIPTINLARIRKGFAWQSRYLSWIANRNPYEYVQCYRVIDFGLFNCLRRNTIRFIYFDIVNANNESLLYEISLCYSNGQSYCASLSIVKHMHLKFVMTEGYSNIPKRIHYNSSDLWIMALFYLFLADGFWRAVLSLCACKIPLACPFWTV